LTILDTAAASSHALTVSLHRRLVLYGNPAEPVPLDCGVSCEAIADSFSHVCCEHPRGRAAIVDQISERNNSYCLDFRSSIGCLLTPHRMRPAVFEAASAPEAMSCDPSESRPRTAYRRWWEKPTMNQRLHGLSGGKFRLRAPATLGNGAAIRFVPARLPLSKTKSRETWRGRHSGLLHGGNYPRRVALALWPR
jgi:hypothetical protein